MDKAKTNFIIIISVLVVVSLILIGYVASLSAQLGAEKIKTMQLNDQIAGLSAKAKDLDAQLASATTKAGDQTNLANNLQASVSSLRNSLDIANVELEKSKKAYVDLEAKLKSEAPVNVPQEVSVDAVSASQ